jgi:hypothetical protein
MHLSQWLQSSFTLPIKFHPLHNAFYMKPGSISLSRKQTKFPSFPIKSTNPPTPQNNLPAAGANYIALPTPLLFPLVSLPMLPLRRITLRRLSSSKARSPKGPMSGPGSPHSLSLVLMPLLYLLEYVPESLTRAGCIETCLGFCVGSPPAVFSTS